MGVLERFVRDHDADDMDWTDSRGRYSLGAFKPGSSIKLEFICTDGSYHGEWYHNERSETTADVIDITAPGQVSVDEELNPKRL